ncbi:MAG: hypothetical protein ISN29_09585, partial [Gammaproteobacteria bacterium AqS3]|nr:hypothetical protein [Gammaproteobacteria bacterium AqS3]
AAANPEVTVDKTRLTFTTSNWRQAQEVEVSAAEDDDAIDDSATIKLTASGGGYDEVTGSVEVEVEDDDETGLVITADDPFEVTEGGEETFTVALASEPSGEVTVELARSGDTDVTLDKNSLSFTADSWDTPQTVTVRAVQDDDAVNDSATIILTAAGGDYEGKAGSVEVTVDDNDEATLVITAAEPFEVAEGRSATFTVQLESEPSGEVTVTLGQDGDTANPDVRLDKTSLTFTADDWGTPQTVTVRAVQDDDAVNDIVTLTLTAAGGDYAGVSGSVKLTVKDDDEAALVLSDRHLSFEEGESASFKVQLKTRPSADVTVALGRPDHPDIRVDKTSLRFTADDWNTAQTVTVSAAEDDDADNETGLKISLSASGGDYEGVSDKVDVVVEDTGTLALVLSATSLTVEEGGEKSFTVQLESRPSDDVTVALVQSGTANDDLTFDTDGDADGNQTQLTFTVDNWDDGQTVTVSTAQDDDAVNDSATISLSASGGGYDEVTGSLEVEVEDDDTAKLVIAADSDPLAVDEGGEETFTVQLASEPSEAVTVELARSGDTDVTLDKNSLTFTASDWNSPQTVTVSAAEDNDIVDDSATIRLTASGADYGGVSGSVDVKVNDTDEATLIITVADPFKIDEEDSAAFKVQLGIRPASDVRVELTQPDNTDVTVDVDPNAPGNQATLTFTAGNWNADQIVTVRAAHDPDTQDEEATIGLSASGGGYKDITASVKVTVKDNDTPGLMLSPNKRKLDEGTSAIFTVVLATQPQ